MGLLLTQKGRWINAEREEAAGRFQHRRDDDPDVSRIGRAIPDRWRRPGQRL